MILVLLVAATPWSRRSLQPDVTLCETSVLLALIDTAIPPACEPMLRDAVTSGAEVDHAKLCQCYLEVPDSTMSNLTCAARAGDRQTIYEEYQRCHDFAVVPPRAAGCVGAYIRYHVIKENGPTAAIRALAITKLLLT